VQYKCLLMMMMMMMTPMTIFDENNILIERSAVNNARTGAIILLKAVNVAYTTNSRSAGFRCDCTDVADR